MQVQKGKGHPVQEFSSWLSKKMTRGFKSKFPPKVCACANSLYSQLVSSFVCFDVWVDRGGDIGRVGTSWVVHHGAGDIVGGVSYPVVGQVLYGLYWTLSNHVGVVLGVVRYFVGMCTSLTSRPLCHPLVRCPWGRCLSDSF